MKSGRKIFSSLEFAEDYTESIRKLGNGSLRSLLHYLTHSRLSRMDDPEHELIHTTAIVIAAMRFVKGDKPKPSKGHKKGRLM